MPKFIYVSDNKITLSSTIETITYTCVSEALTITEVSVTPSDTPLLWTQTQGSTVTILNPTTINPTIVFPTGFNTESGTVVLQLSVVGYSDIYLTINVNTRIASIYDTTKTYSTSLNRNTYLPPDSIPSSLTYYYQDYYSSDIGIAYQTNTNPVLVTYKNPNTISNLSILRVDWLQNIGGVYTLVSSSISPNRSFSYTRGIPTKAKVYYLINSSKQEVVNTGLLDTSLLKDASALGVSNYRNNSNTNIKGSASTITRNDYIFNLIDTQQSYESNYSIGLSNTNAETSTITKSYYIFNIIETSREEDEESLIINEHTSTKNIVITISRSDYTFSTSGTIIGE